MSVYIREGFWAPREFVDRKWVYMELSDLVALADQTEKLALRRLQGRIRHHVEQSNVELADVLLLRSLRRQHGGAIVLQALERR